MSKGFPQKRPKSPREINRTDKQSWLVANKASQLENGINMEKNIFSLTARFPQIFDCCASEEETPSDKTKTLLQLFNTLKRYLIQFFECEQKSIRDWVSIKNLNEKAINEFKVIEQDGDIPRYQVELFALRLLIVRIELLSLPNNMWKEVSDLCDTITKNFKHLSEAQKNEVNWYKSIAVIKEFCEKKIKKQDWLRYIEHGPQSTKLPISRQIIMSLYNAFQPTISFEEAKKFVELNNSLASELSEPNAIAFLSVFSLIEGFPSWALFQDATYLHWDIEGLKGEYSQICLQYLLSQLSNSSLFSFHIDEDPFDPDNEYIGLSTVFDDIRHDVKLTLRGEKTSLRRFCAHLQLVQLECKFEPIEGITTNQQRHFESIVFSELERVGYLNASKSISNVKTWEEETLKHILKNSMEMVIGGHVPDTWIEELDFDQFERKVRAFNEQNNLLSGLPQDDAILLYCHALKSDERGLNSDVCEQIKSTLEFCLKIYLKLQITAEYTSEIEKEDSFKKIATEVLKKLNESSPVIIGSGTPISSTGVVSSHGFYVALQIINKKTRIIIIDGEADFERFYEKERLKVGEHPYCSPAAFEFIETIDDAVLEDYVLNVLKLPFKTALNEEDRNSLVGQIYFCDGKGTKQESELFRRIEISGRFPLQSRGTCTVHNLKYIVQAAFQMDEKVMGDMIRSLVIGIDKLARSFQLTEQPDYFPGADTFMPVKFGNIFEKVGFIIDVGKRHEVKEKLELSENEDGSRFKSLIAELIKKKTELAERENNGLMVTVKVDRKNEVAFAMHTSAGSKNGYLVSWGRGTKFFAIKNIQYGEFNELMISKESIKNAFQNTTDKLSEKHLATISFVIAEAMRFEIIFDCVVHIFDENKEFKWSMLKTAILNNYGKILKHRNAKFTLKKNEGKRKSQNHHNHRDEEHNYKQRLNNPRLSNTDILSFAADNIETNGNDILEVFAEVYTHAQVLEMIKASNFETLQISKSRFF